jgi:hypothetical protein
MEWSEGECLSCDEDGVLVWTVDVILSGFVWLLWPSGHLPDDKV